MYLLREPIPWSEAILSGFATWYPWLLLGPGIFWLSSRFPFEPGRWATAIAVHVPAGLVFALLHGVLRAAVSRWVDFTPIPAMRLILGQMLLAYLSYTAILAVDQAWVNYRRFRDRELRTSQLESKLAQAQLEVLRMQLHPHFLFNTLHAISTLIHRDPEAADEMVSQLSELLRMTLDKIRGAGGHASRGARLPPAVPRNPADQIPRPPARQPGHPTRNTGCPRARTRRFNLS